MSVQPLKTAARDPESASSLFPTMKLWKQDSHQAGRGSEEALPAHSGPAVPGVAPGEPCVNHAGLGTPCALAVPRPPSKRPRSSPKCASSDGPRACCPLSAAFQLWVPGGASAGQPLPPGQQFLLGNIRLLVLAAVSFINPSVLELKEPWGAVSMSHCLSCSSRHPPSVVRHPRNEGGGR